MANPENIYGDRAAMANVPANRPTVLMVTGDSIVNRWITPFVRRIKGLVGYCSEITGLHNFFNGSAYVNGGDGLTPPASPGAYVARYANFATYAHTGTGTSTGATSAGATSMPIALSSGGLPDLTFPIVIGTGGTQETAYLDPASWLGNGSTVLITPLVFTAPLTFAHASGTTISWQRPSGQTAYWPGNTLEATFASAASPQNGSQFAGRLLDVHGLGDVPSYGEAPESQLFTDGYILSRFSVNVYLFYWALPVNIGAPLLRLHGLTAEASPAHVFTDFSIYAATPTIRCVKLTIPAPTSYLKTVTWRATVNSPNAGSFTAGQVFAAIKLIGVRAGATSGTIAISATTGGMKFTDLTGDPTRYGPQWSTANRQQFVAAMASAGLGTIDQLMIHLGTNDGFVDPPTTLGIIKQCATDMQAVNPNVNTIYVSDYATTNNVASGQGANMSAATKLIDGQTQIVGFDQFALPDMTGAEITSLVLSDGTHPEPAAGYAIVGNRISDFYRVDSFTSKASNPTFSYSIVPAAVGSGNYSTAFHVTDGTKLVAGAAVVIALSGVTTASGTTDIYGNFVATLAAGTYTISISRAGFSALTPTTFTVQ